MLTLLYTRGKLHTKKVLEANWNVVLFLFYKQCNQSLIVAFMALFKRFGIKSVYHGHGPFTFLIVKKNKIRLL